MRSRGGLDDRWAEREWQTRLLLHLLVLGATAVAFGAVSWASGADPAYLLLIVVVAGGHYMSARWGEGPPGAVRPVVYAIVGLLIWTMRAELLVIVSGGSLFLMSRLLAAFQAIASFNMRGLRSLYDSLLLSLVILMLVSEAALTPTYMVFLGGFGVIAMIFLAAANPLVESSNRHRWNTVRMPSLGWAAPALMVLTLVVGAGVFVVLPQTYLLRDAMPLPSRLDLAVGRPVAPAPLPANDGAGSSGFLPTGEDELLSDAGSPAYTGYATLGYTGERTEDVVMHVRSPLTSYWRGQVLEEYDGRGWRAVEGADQVELDALGAPVFSDAPAYGTGAGRYVQTFFPRVRQPEAIFTGYTPGYIAVLDAPPIGRFSDSQYPAIARLREASSYSVTSGIPRLTPNQLILDTADALYLTRHEMPEVPQRVQDLARSIVEGATSDFQKAARLEQYLLLNYDYDLRVAPLPPSRDVVDEFLFERQAGYCAHFATAMALMARLVGLPARVAVGYIPGAFDPLSGTHTVRYQDAHAWVEIGFVGHGWVAFDPSPRPDSPFALDPGLARATRSFQSVLRGQIAGWFRRMPNPAGQIGALRAVGVPILMAIAVAGVLIMAAGMWMAIRSLRARSVAGPGSAGYRLLDGDARREAVRAYRRAVRFLRRRGFPLRQAHESPRDYAVRLESEGLPVPHAFLRMTRIATEALYDPAEPRPETGPEARILLKTLYRAGVRSASY